LFRPGCTTGAPRDVPFENAVCGLADVDSVATPVGVVVAAPGLTVFVPTVPMLAVVVAAVPGFTFFTPGVIAGALKGPTVVAAPRKVGFFP